MPTLNADRLDLEEQEAQGQVSEEVEKLVDGVIEDIRSGYVSNQVAALNQVVAAALLCAHATEFQFAMNAIRYYGQAEFEDIVLETAQSLIAVLTRSELEKRTEFQQLDWSPNVAKSNQKTTQKTTQTPAKAATPKKPAVPAMLPKLKPNKMTDSKLKKLQDKHRSFEFLLDLKYDDLYQSDKLLRACIEEAVNAAVCTSENMVTNLSTAIHSLSANGKIITLKCKVKMMPFPPAVPETFPSSVTDNQTLTPDNPQVTITVPAPTPSMPHYPAAETGRYKTGEAVRVHATLLSDDKLQKVTFDCTDWFEQASDETIVQLANEMYKHDDTSDSVAIFFESDEALKQVFNYVENLATNPETRDLAGFGVEVDPEQAVAWITKHREHLVAMITNTESPVPTETPAA